jgi:hypothetical protein
MYAEQTLEATHSFSFLPRAIFQCSSIHTYRNTVHGSTVHGIMRDSLVDCRICSGKLPQQRGKISRRDGVCAGRAEGRIEIFCLCPLCNGKRANLYCLLGCAARRFTFVPTPAPERLHSGICRNSTHTPECPQLVTVSIQSRSFPHFFRRELVVPNAKGGLESWILDCQV